MNKHRDTTLDSLIGETVLIYLEKDCMGSESHSKGTLYQGDDYGPSVKQGLYYLESLGGGYSFRKSHVKEVVEA